MYLHVMFWGDKVERVNFVSDFNFLRDCLETTIRKVNVGRGGRRSTKKYSCKGKLREQNTSYTASILSSEEKNINALTNQNFSQEKKIHARDFADQNKITT